MRAWEAQIIPTEALQYKKIVLRWYLSLKRRIPSYYIERKEKIMIKDDRIFCKIAKGDIPSATIYEDSDIRVILDVAPANRGHALILTKEHFDNIYEMDEATGAKVFAKATSVAKAIKTVTNCEGMNVLQNNGEVAGQTVHHFHLHLVPRFKDDEVNMSWNPKTTVAEEQQALAEAIKKGL